MSKEEFAKIIDALKEKLDETTNALVSEELLAILSAYNTAVDDNETSVAEIEKLKGEKEELLKVNGKLYQKIGFDKEDEPDPEPTEDEKEEEITIDDVIDEKGELI